MMEHSYPTVSATEAPVGERSDLDVVLAVRDLVVEFQSRNGTVRAVDRLSFDLRAGETLAMVGESGSGKSSVALALLGLTPRPPKCRVSGHVYFGDRDLLLMTERDWRTLRGREIAMIFQDPMTALDPVSTVGSQIVEALRIHDRRMSRPAARSRAADLLKTVGIPNSNERLNAYPHQFSGGMRQRVMIAIAISNNPRVLVADEPTTALDVTIQKQIMHVLETARNLTNASTILITHDLGLVAEAAQRLLVMYAGRASEYAEVSATLNHPRHPYTIGLLNSLPNADMDGQTLKPIPGSPPNLASIPTGCAFHPRCALSAGRSKCRNEVPQLLPLETMRGKATDASASCHFVDETSAAEVASKMSVEVTGVPDEVF